MAILSTSPVLEAARDSDQTIIQTVSKVSTTQLFTVTLGSGRETNGPAKETVAPPTNNGISQSTLGGVIGGVVGAIVLLLLAWACCGRVRFPKSPRTSTTSGATSGSPSSSGSSGQSDSGSEMEETEWVDGQHMPRPMAGGPPPMPPGAPWPGAPPGPFPMGRGGPPGMGRGMPMPMPMPMGMGRGVPPPPPPMQH